MHAAGYFMVPGAWVRHWAVETLRLSCRQVRSWPAANPDRLPQSLLTGLRLASKLWTLRTSLLRTHNKLSCKTHKTRNISLKIRSAFSNISTCSPAQWAPGYAWLQFTTTGGVSLSFELMFITETSLNFHMTTLIEDHIGICRHLGETFFLLGWTIN